MIPEIDKIIKEAKDKMQAALEHLANELTNIRAGKASPAMLNGVKVDYYGTPTPLTQISNINTPDAKTISIQPWEKGLLENIEKAIFEANLGVTPQNNGELIMIYIPPLTEERRKDLVKQAKAEGEQAKVSIRTARKDANDNIKKLKSDISEDIIKDAEDNVQKTTDNYVSRVDELIAKKEKDILTV